MLGSDLAYLFAQLCLANLGILQLLGKLLRICMACCFTWASCCWGLGSMLLSELLGLSDLVLRFLKLCGELIDLLLLTLSHDHLLLGRCQLTGQVLGLCA